MKSATSAHPSSYPATMPVFGRLILALLFVLIWLITAYHVMPPDIFQDNRLKLEEENTSGRNEPHANQKAREKAQQEYEKVREEYQQWNRKPNKTPDDKKFIEKLRKQLERFRKKKDFNGENHSQKHKGN